MCMCTPSKHLPDKSIIFVHKMSENRELFIVNQDKPMKFTVVNCHTMLNIKRKHLSKKILSHGGIEIPYDIKDEECIILSPKSIENPEDEDVFDIKFVNDCISQNKILNLQKYRLCYKIRKGMEENSIDNGECAFAKKVRSMKCIHMNRAPEEDLKIIHQL